MIGAPCSQSIDTIIYHDLNSFIRDGLIIFEFCITPTNAAPLASTKMFVLIYHWLIEQ